MTDTNKAVQYVANWQDERNGAALYRAISEVEKNPQLKTVYQRLAEAEERHSGITLLTGRNVFYPGTRQVILGLLAAGITFSLGRVIGTSLAE